MGNIREMLVIYEQKRGANMYISLGDRNPGTPVSFIST